MSQPENDQNSRWIKPLLYLVTGFIVFETLTGLSIYFLPFSLANQVMVLIHTGVGLVFLLPYLWYQYRHWLTYKSRPWNEFVVTGYVSMTATLVAVVSGIVLTWQAIFGLHIVAFWKNIHIVATFALIAALIPHIGLIFYRDSKAPNKFEENDLKKTARKQFGFNSFYIVFLQFAIVGLFMFAYTPREFSREIPDDYYYHHGSESPFYPSLASTADGKLIPAELLGGSDSCGTAGCHSEIYEEWEVSAHRYSAEDPFFRVIQQNMGEQKGAVAARYCAGCHDPIGLFAGSANLYADDLTNQIGLKEGVSCISCHAISEADVQGNADFVIDLPERYIFELHDSKLAKWISDFLIRAYPEKHVESYRRPLYKTSEYCGACHKQYIDEDINDVGWVQLQNQYDQWRKSHWFTDMDPISTVECRECHMPLIESIDPSSGDALDYNRSPNDGMHRSHRFLGANQFVPELLDLPNAEEHIKLIEEWLRGEFEIPEIENKWVSGPAVPITVIAQDSVRAGESLRMDVLITNKKAGHEFPTGPLDMIQTWIEIIAKDQNGNRLFESGTLDDNFFIEPGAFMFKAEPVDQYGNLIDRHNLWEMVGVRYSRALYPGRSDYARFFMQLDDEETKYQVIDEENPAVYTLDNIPETVTEVRITAKLQYRKINQFLMNEVFADVVESETSPITTVSEHTRNVKIIQEVPLP
jgi:hypothetical protein